MLLILRYKAQSLLTSRYDNCLLNKGNKGGQLTTCEKGKEGLESRMMYRFLALVIELVGNIIILKTNMLASYF